MNTVLGIFFMVVMYIPAFWWMSRTGGNPGFFDLIIYGVLIIAPIYFASKGREIFKTQDDTDNEELAKKVRAGEYVSRESVEEKAKKTGSHLQTSTNYVPDKGDKAIVGAGKKRLAQQKTAKEVMQALPVVARKACKMMQDACVEKGMDPNDPSLEEDKDAIRANCAILASTIQRCLLKNGGMEEFVEALISFRNASPKMFEVVLTLLIGELNLKKGEFEDAFGIRRVV